MITVILDKDNIAIAVINTPSMPEITLSNGESLIEVSSEPELGLQYDSSTKSFVKSDIVKFKEIKLKRDELLKNSDFTQLSDSTHPGTKEEWKVYRQKLRDIAKDITDPDTIVFPEEPK